MLGPLGVPVTDAVEALTDARDLAALATQLSNPNPRVGCILTAPDGRVIGIG